MLGGTGQGKTAFLNLLANVKNVFKNVNGIESCKNFNEESVESHIGGAMTSKTSDAVKYIFKIGHAIFTVIDTPGFGDSRGMDMDATHFEKIKQTVLDEGEINCVCVVQNGREARISTQLMYSFSSLTSILPQAISHQIIFVYTNCERQSNMNFHHPSVNQFFGFQNSTIIPFIVLDNPLVYV